MLLEPPVPSGPYRPPEGSANLGRTLLFGPTSITGYALARLCGGNLLAIANRSSSRPGWQAVDAENRVAMAALLRRERPETVIWAHAVCDVVKCEAAPAWAMAINVGGVENLLRHLPSTTRLVYVSSDHVFGGDGTYTEVTPPVPISVYGRTRVAAEKLILQQAGALVIRPGLAIGSSADGRSGFLDWLSYRHRRGLPVTVVGDESRSVVWADDLAARILALAASDLAGLRHIPAGAVSRPDLARHLLRLRGIEPRFEIRTRAEQKAPHLGRVELRTIHDDEFASPLPAVMKATIPDHEQPARRRGRG